MKYFLLAIHPFDKLELELSGLRQAIFREYGYASALALPPLLPLCWLPADLNLNAVKLALARYRPGVRFTLAGIREEQGSLFLRTICSRPFAELRRELAACVLATRRPGAESVFPVEPLFQVVDGFLLAAGLPAQTTDQWQLPAALGQTTAFSSYQLTLFRLETYTGSAAWWENLAWEFLITVKKKLRANHWKESGK